MTPAFASSRAGSALRRLRANGAELRYLECGRGEPLVLVHGGSGDYQSWQRQIGAFSKRYRVVAYSRRYSYPNANPITSERCLHLDALDLSALIEARAPRGAHLVGHSYGALTSLAAVLGRSELARSLVLVEPPLFAWVADAADGRALIEAMTARVRTPALEAFGRGNASQALRIFTDGLCGRGYFDQLPRSEQARRLRNAPAVHVLMQSVGAFPALSPARAQRLRTPTLLIEGEHTTALHRRADDAILRRIAGSRRVVVPNATHWVPYDNPRAFNRAVLRFLDEVAGPPAPGSRRIAIAATSPITVAGSRNPHRTRRR